MNFTELQSRRQKLLDQKKQLVAVADLAALIQVIDEIKENTDLLLQKLPAIFQARELLLVVHARGDGYQVSTFSPEMGLLGDSQDKNLEQLVGHMGINHLPVRGEDEVEPLLLQAIKAEAAYQERRKNNDVLWGQPAQPSF